MIIGIDGNEANVERKVGISEYAYELLLQFAKFEIRNSKFEIYLKHSPNADMPQISESWLYRIVKPTKLWTQLGLPLDLFIKKPRPDVFFSPTHYAPRFCPVPSVISVMDLSYIYYPELFKKEDLYKLKNWTKYSVLKAKKILTISSASKSDIIKTYGVSEDKVVVTYPGIKFKVKSEKFKVDMEELKKKYGISGQYVLFVGTLQPRKNIVRLVEAFYKILPKHKDLELIIVGKKGWLYEEILAAPKQYHVEENVKFLEFVSNDDLPSLYKNALCFVLPSLYEGFGLPVVEAMHYGCPVITSNVSSLPEAGGDAVVYVDPLSVNDIADKMIEVVSNKKLREEMISKGKKQAARFSWEKTAKKTLEVLTEVAEKNV